MKGVYRYQNIGGMLITMLVLASIVLGCRNRLDRLKPSCESFLDHDLAIGWDIMPPANTPSYRYPRFIPGTPRTLVYIRDNKKNSSLIQYDLEEEKSFEIYRSEKNITSFDINADGEFILVEEGELWIGKEDKESERIVVELKGEEIVYKANWIQDHILLQVRAGDFKEIDRDGKLITDYQFPIEVRDFWADDSIIVVANVEEIRVYEHKSKLLQRTYDISKFNSAPYVNGTLGAFQTENRVSISVAFLPYLFSTYQIYLASFHDIYRLEHQVNGYEEAEWHRWGCYIPGVGLDVEAVTEAKVNLASAVIDVAGIPKNRDFGIMVLMKSKEYTLFP